MLQSARGINNTTFLLQLRGSGTGRSDVVAMTEGLTLAFSLFWDYQIGRGSGYGHKRRRKDTQGDLFGQVFRICLSLYSLCHPAATLLIGGISYNHLSCVYFFTLHLIPFGTILVTHNSFCRRILHHTRYKRIDFLTGLFLAFLRIPSAFLLVETL